MAFVTIPDLQAIAGDLLQDFCRSDVGNVAPSRAYVWLAVGAAHIGMGMAVALSPLRKFAMALLVAFLVREFACDLRHDGYPLPTWLDSAFDTAMVVFGFKWAMRALEGRPFPNDGKPSRAR